MFRGSDRPLPPAVRLRVTDLGLGLGVALLFTYLTLVPAFSWPAGLTSQTRLVLRAACCFVVW